jgi:UDP-glucose 4-epimerase
MIQSDGLKMKTILITGGAGYIGSNLAHRLSSSGNKVLVLDNLESGLTENLPARGIFFKGDVGDRSLLREIFSNNRIDIVFHFAARKNVFESTVNPNLYMEENVEKTSKLMEILNEFNCTKLVFASTAAVYGNRDVREKGYSETDVPLPTNPYGLSKLLAEQRILEVTKYSNLKVIVFRFFNVAMSESQMNSHPGEDILSILTDCVCSGKTFEIFGQDYPTFDGTCYRDFIHITDLLDALELSHSYLEKTNDSFSVFNLGSGGGISLGELTSLGSKILGGKFSYKYVTPRTGDIAFSLADISKSEVKLAWVPKISPEYLFTIFFEKLKVLHLERESNRNQD